MSENSLHLFKFENKEDADNFLDYTEEVPTTLRSFPTRTVTAQPVPIYDVRNTSTVLGVDPITDSYYAREDMGYLRITKQLSIGSITADNIHNDFFTSNMVGIGTTTPTSILDVFNGTTDGSILRLRGGNAAAPDHGPRIDFSIGNTTTTDNYVGAAIKSLNFFTGDQHAAHLAFYTRSWNGSVYSGLDERVRITSSGNVGIGTNSPSSLLHVFGNTTDSIIIDRTISDFGSTPTETGILFKLNDDNNQGSGAIRLWNNDTGTGQEFNRRLNFYVENSETLTTPKMTIVHDGKVGIGTNTPTSTLDVTGEAIFRGENLWIRGYTSAGQTGTRIINTGGNTYLDNKGTGHIIFRTDNTAGGTERMRITSTGNVGIGNTTPGYLLDVRNSVRLGNHVIEPGTMELNQLGSGDRTTFLDFHSQNGADYSARIIRWAGANGTFDFVSNTTLSNQENIRFIIGTKPILTLNPLVFGPGFSLGRVSVNGYLSIQYVSEENYNNLQWDANTGAITYDNSSRRYKTNIVELSECVDFHRILQVTPKRYTRKKEFCPPEKCPETYAKKEEIGFIAEELEAVGGLERLLFYDKEGRVDSINYTKMAVCFHQPLIKELFEKTSLYEQQIETINTNDKERDTKIHTLENELKEEKVKVADLQTKYDTLLSFLQSKFPNEL